MQDAGDLGFIGIAAHLFILHVQPIQLFDPRRVAFSGFDLGGHLFDLRFQTVDVGKDLIDLSDHGAFAVKVVALLQIAHARILRHEKLPLICRKFSGQQLEESRLARAVPADDADTVAGIDVETDILQDHVGAV